MARFMAEKGRGTALEEVFSRVAVKGRHAKHDERLELVLELRKISSRKIAGGNGAPFMDSWISAWSSVRLSPFAGTTLV